MLKYEGTDKIRDIKYEDGYVDKIYYDNNTQLVFTSDKEKTGVDKVLFKGRKLVDVTSYGKCVQTNLPLGYTQLEYIESTGTQYIDTGVNIGENIQTKVKFGKTTKSFTKFGFIIGGGGHYQGLVTRTSQNSYYMSMYNSSQNTVVITMPDDVFEVTFNTPEHKVIINNTDSFDLVLISPYEINTTIGVFNTPNTSGNIGIGKVYSFVIKDNSSNSIVSNLIPAKNASNIVGMYDTVSGQFFTNAGTGDFIAGPNTVPTPDTPIDIVCNNGVLKARHQSGLPLGYTLLDYIETDGNSWFATGINVDATTELEITASNITSVSSQLMVTRTISTGKYFRLAKATASQRLIGSVGSQTITDLNNDGTNKFTAKVNISSFYVDGTLIDNFESATPDLSEMTEVDVFKGTYGSNTYYAYAGSRLHRAIIRKNNIAVIDLIPCKNASNVVGMYDTVNGVFYQNAGTGDFVAGTAVSDPIEIYTDGTAETINAHGKNLWNKTMASTKFIKLDTEVGKEYTVSAGTVSANTTTYFYLQKSESGGEKELLNRIMSGKYSSRRSTTFTAQADTEYYLWSNYTYTNIKEIQVEEGDTETPYEPYYDGGTATTEMLLKVGNYQDQQDIISGDVTRRVGVKVLDGTENWTSSITYNGSTYIPAPHGYINNKPLLCTHFVSATQPTVDFARGKCLINGNSLSLWYSNNRTTAVANIKQYLADQYAAGTPVIVIYPLATPTTEQVLGQQLTIQQGNNTVEVTQASVDAIQLKVKYK